MSNGLVAHLQFLKLLQRRVIILLQSTMTVSRAKSTFARKIGSMLILVPKDIPCFMATRGQVLAETRLQRE